MPERSSIAQVSQIGVESTPGTAVAATRRLGSMSIMPSPTVEVSSFRPMGVKFTTITALNREWADVSAEGQPTYEEVVIPLHGAVGTPVVADILDGATPTGATRWTFTPSSSAADNPKTFTLEHGQDSVQAERFAHLLFGSFGLSINRSEVSLSASGFARRMETGFNPTDGLAIPADLSPIMPGHFTVTLAETAAALGTTDVIQSRVVSVEPSLEDRYNPAWFVNQAEDSFATFVESPDGVGGGVGMTLEADTQGMAWVDRLRDGSTHFLRLEALGRTIYDAGTQLDLRERFTWDMAVKVTNMESYSDEDGIYALPFTFTLVHDSTWGKAMQIEVVNTLAAL